MIYSFPIGVEWHGRVYPSPEGVTSSRVVRWLFYLPTFTHAFKRTTSLTSRGDLRLLVKGSLEGGGGEPGATPGERVGGSCQTQKDGLSVQWLAAEERTREVMPALQWLSSTSTSAFFSFFPY